MPSTPSTSTDMIAAVKRPLTPVKLDAEEFLAHPAQPGPQPDTPSEESDPDVRTMGDAKGKPSVESLPAWEPAQQVNLEVGVQPGALDEVALVVAEAAPAHPAWLTAYLTAAAGTQEGAEFRAHVPRSAEEAELMVDCLRRAEDGARADPATAQHIPRGSLDRLYLAWRQALAPQVRDFAMEDTARLMAWCLELGVSADKFTAVLQSLKRNDLLRQLFSSLVGGGVFISAAAAQRKMIEDGDPDPQKLLVNTLVLAGAAMFTTRVFRKANLLPNMTATRVMDAQGHRVPPLRTAEGAVRTAAAFWPFSIMLPLVLLLTRIPEDTPAAERKAQLAMKLHTARMMWNPLASAGVGLHRFFLVGDRQPLQPDASRTRPGGINPALAPQDVLAIKKSAFQGLLNEHDARNQPTARSAALSGLDALLYVKRAIVGMLVAAVTLLDWSRSERAGFRASAPYDLAKVATFVGFGAMISLIPAAFAAVEDEDATFALGLTSAIALVPHLYGTAHAMGNWFDAMNPSARADNERNEATTLLALARAGGRVARPDDIAPHLR